MTSREVHRRAELLFGPEYLHRAVRLPVLRAPGVVAPFARTEADPLQRPRDLLEAIRVDVVAEHPPFFPVAAW